MTNARAVKSLAPPQLCDYLDGLSEPVVLRELGIIGGGAVRDFYAQAYPRDVDVFVRPGGASLTVAVALEGAGYVLEKDGSRVMTYRRAGYPSVQVCEWRFEDVRDLVAGFDFTVCQCAVTGRDVWASPFFRTDLNQKVLRLSHVASPLHTLKRAGRFIEAGYRPVPGMVAELAERIEHALRKASVAEAPSEAVKAVCDYAASGAPDLARGLR